ncbi:MAG: hypothetical protein ACTSVV_09605 [Promethearchaeota archaeon]
MNDKRELDLKIKSKFEISPDFKRYYVTGALGGFRNPYDFRLSFFNIKSNDFLLILEKFKEKGLSEDEFKKEISNLKMPHEIVCELIMSKQAVQELYEFIGKELAAQEKIENESKKS